VGHGLEGQQEAGKGKMESPKQLDFINFM